jgi:hypothetical protein
VCTNHIIISEAQTARMNDCIGERGLGMGDVLVHKLTTSDIEHNGLVKYLLKLLPLCSFF